MLEKPLRLGSGYPSLRRGLAFGVFLLFASEGWAQYGPFAELPGDWLGEGQILLNGKSERIRCRALYVVSEEGNELRQDLRCATTNNRFHLRTNVIYRGGIVSGT